MCQTFPNDQTPHSGEPLQFDLTVHGIPEDKGPFKYDSQLTEEQIGCIETLVEKIKDPEKADAKRKREEKKLLAELAVPFKYSPLLTPKQIKNIEERAKKIKGNILKANAKRRLEQDKLLSPVLQQQKKEKRTLQKEQYDKLPEQEKQKIQENRKKSQKERRDNMPPEEREASLKKKREDSKERYHNLDPQEKAELLEKGKNYRAQKRKQGSDTGLDVNHPPLKRQRRNKENPLNDPTSREPQTPNTPIAAQILTELSQGGYATPQTPSLLEAESSLLDLQ
jgi:hypothetical protein